MSGAQNTRYHGKGRPFALLLIATAPVCAHVEIVLAFGRQAMPAKLRSLSGPDNPLRK